MSKITSNEGPSTLDVIARHGRTHVSTKEAAQLLNRESQTLRIWACKENGPIVPTRIHGRLHWPIAEICRLLRVDGLPAA